MRAIAVTTIFCLFAAPAHAREPCPYKAIPDAFVASQELVRDKLKAPSTAKFPSHPVNDDNNHAIHINGCSFSILSHVDAENAFSAMLRARYAATMEYDAAQDRWTGYLIWVPADF